MRGRHQARLRRPCPQTPATANRTYDVAIPGTLSAMLSSHCKDSEVTAVKHAAQLNLRRLTALRSGNDYKDSMLLAALDGQVGVVVGLAVTVLAMW